MSLHHSQKTCSVQELYTVSLQEPSPALQLFISIPPLTHTHTLTPSLSHALAHRQLEIFLEDDHAAQTTFYSTENQSVARHKNYDFLEKNAPRFFLRKYKITSFFSLSFFFTNLNIFVVFGKPLSLVLTTSVSHAFLRKKILTFLKKSIERGFKSSKLTKILKKSRMMSFCCHGSVAIL